MHGCVAGELRRTSRVMLPPATEHIDQPTMRDGEPVITDSSRPVVPGVAPARGQVAELTLTWGRLREWRLAVERVRSMRPQTAGAADAAPPAASAAPARASARSGDWG